MATVSAQQLDQMVNGPSTVTKLAPLWRRAVVGLVTWLARIVRAVRPYLTVGVLGVLMFPLAAAMINHALAVAILGVAFLVIERAVKG